MRAVRTLAIGLAGLLLVLALAAWLVPPMLDWGRYRATFAAVAGGRLGRRVEIAGGVTLRLLPHAVLTATQVTLPDQGDGLSATLATLRLQVALGALAGGRIVATDLVLGGPVLRLPWPLPAAIADPLRPPVPRGFGARIEGGSLTVGGLALGAINASLVGDAAAGSLRASGEATAGGLPWRFRAILGAPGEGGASPVDIAVAGQDELRDTGGTFAGRLSGKDLAGTVDLGGGNLALLAGGPRVAWRVRGPVSARRDRIEAPALDLESGDGRAKGSATLSLAGTPRLDLSVATPSVAPALWWPLTVRMGPGLPFALDFSADRAQLLGDQLNGLGLRVEGDGSGIRLEHARAVLPGGAMASLSGRLGHDAAGWPTIAGPATLDAPDLGTTLHWLRPLAPALLEGLADRMAANGRTSARLAGQASLARALVEARALTGSVGDDPVAGDVALRLGTRPGVVADLRLDRLALGASVPRLPLHFTAPPLDADIQVQAGAATLWGVGLADLSLHAKAGAGGVQLLKATAKLAGADLGVSGSMASDGNLTDARVSADIHDLAKAMDKAPAGWKSSAPLWQGPATVELSASGPQESLALQLRASAGDLRIEAEGLLDARQGQASATITLRHPGAPRLLADLGLPGAEPWLDTGSAALICHLRLTPWHVAIQDFDLSAAALHAGGRADIDLSGKAPRLAATLKAETLPLPGWTVWRALPDLPSWAAKAEARLHVEASEILAGLRPAASHASADIGIEQGILLADPIGASLAGGTLSAAVAADLSQSPPRMAARGDLVAATLPGPLTGLPVDLVDTSLDLTASLDARGASPAALAASASGEALATVKATSVAGLDLPRLILSLDTPRRTREADLRAALTSGATTGFAGTVEAGLASGRMTIRRGLLNAPSGTLTIAGHADMAEATTSLQIVARPALPSPPSIGIDLSGNWTAPHRADSVSEALDWGTHTQPRARPAARHGVKPHRP